METQHANACTTCACYGCKNRIDQPLWQPFTPPLRFALMILLLLSLTCSGCGGRKASPVYGPAPGSGAGIPVNPAGVLIGKIVSVNGPARFAVLNFPIGKLPALDQRLGVYRKGLKVGEVKVTGPQRDDNIVGDITAGDAAPGDEVREQ